MIASSTDHRTGGRGGVVLRRPESRPRTHVRKLCANGNSLTVSVPWGIQKSCNLLQGDFLEISALQDGSGFFVRVLRPDRPATPAPTTGPLLEELAR